MKGPAILMSLAIGTGLASKVFMTVPEALVQCFPSAGKVKRTSVFLTNEQLAEARKLAGPDVELNSQLWFYYTPEGDSPAGYVYFDTHTVRTQKETLMVHVDPQARVLRVETLAFSEPEDYLATERFKGQFRSRQLDSRLSVRGDLYPIAGATLTANATIRSVRRVLAIHQVIHGTTGIRVAAGNR